MKKMLISIALILGCLIFKNTVYASCSISAFTNNSVEIDDNYICLANESVSSNSSKTAYNDNGYLVLNNYDGGSIILNSGMGNPISSFKIKLIGDNHITNKNGIGILTFNTGIKFEGTGTITIDAEIPILSYDAEKDVDKEALINGDYSELINNSSNIDKIPSDIEELEENISDNESEIVDVSTEDISDNKKINYYQIVSIILGVACILLIIKNIKIKDKKSR